MGCWSKGPLGLILGWTVDADLFMNVLIRRGCFGAWSLDEQWCSSEVWWWTKNDERLMNFKGLLGLILEEWMYGFQGPSGLDLGRWMNIASRAVGAWSLKKDERRTMNGSSRAVGAWSWRMDECCFKGRQGLILKNGWTDEWIFQGRRGVILEDEWVLLQGPSRLDLEEWMNGWIDLPGPSGLDLGRWMNVASRAVGAWSWRTMNEERRTKNELPENSLPILGVEKNVCELLMNCLEMNEIGFYL